MFPLFGAWQTAYNTANPNVNIFSAGTGSGTGIADAATGTVTIGASDAYLSSADMTQYPNLINIPLTVAALMVNYNVPGLKAPLKLNGTVLASIYSGKITNWNDKAIAALNAGVSLPNLAITTLHRADSSGSSFLFTSYLNAQDPSGWATANVGTTVTWPTTPKTAAETGSGGMVGGQSLINTSAAGGYPIINYEYAVVQKKQPSAAQASALKAFLSWTLTTGSATSFLSAVNFEPLPANVLSIAKTQIASISG